MANSQIFCSVLFLLKSNFPDQRFKQINRSLISINTINAFYEYVHTRYYVLLSSTDPSTIICGFYSWSIAVTSCFLLRSTPFTSKLEQNNPSLCLTEAYLYLIDKFIYNFGHQKIADSQLCSAQFFSFRKIGLVFWWMPWLSIRCKWIFSNWKNALFKSSS